MSFLHPSPRGFGADGSTMLTPADSHLLKQSQKQIETLQSELVESQLELRQMKKKLDEYQQNGINIDDENNHSDDEKSKNNNNNFKMMAAPFSTTHASSGSSSLYFSSAANNHNNNLLSSTDLASLQSYRQEIKALQLKLKHSDDDAKSWREKFESMQREYRMTVVERDSIRNGARDAAERAQKIEQQRLTEIEKLCEQVAKLETDIKVEKAKKYEPSTSSSFDHDMNMNMNNGFKNNKGVIADTPSRLMQLVSSPSLPGSPSRILQQANNNNNNNNNNNTNNNNNNYTDPSFYPNLNSQQPQHHQLGTSTNDSQRLFSLQTENDSLKLRIRSAETRIEELQQIKDTQAKEIREQNETIRRYTYENIGRNANFNNNDAKSNSPSKVQNNNNNNNNNNNTFTSLTSNINNNKSIPKTSTNINNMDDNSSTSALNSVISDLRQSLAVSQSAVIRYKNSFEDSQRMQYQQNANNSTLRIQTERLMSEIVNLEYQLMQSQHSKDLLKMHLDGLVMNSSRKSQSQYQHHHQQQQKQTNSSSLPIVLLPEMDSLSQIKDYDHAFSAMWMQHAMGVSRLEREQTRYLNDLILERCKILEYQLGLSVNERNKIDEEFRKKERVFNGFLKSQQHQDLVKSLFDQDTLEQFAKEQQQQQQQQDVATPMSSLWSPAGPLLAANEATTRALRKEIFESNEKFLKVKIRSEIYLSTSASRIYDSILLSQFSFLEQSRMVKSEIFEASAFAVREQMRISHEEKENQKKILAMTKENETVKKEMEKYKKRFEEDDMLLGDSSPSISFGRGALVGTAAASSQLGRNSTTNNNNNDVQQQTTLRLVLRQLHKTVLESFRLISHEAVALIGVDGGDAMASGMNFSNNNNNNMTEEEEDEKRLQQMLFSSSSSGKNANDNNTSNDVNNNQQKIQQQKHQMLQTLLESIKSISTKINDSLLNIISRNEASSTTNMTPPPLQPQIIIATVHASVTAMQDEWRKILARTKQQNDMLRIEQHEMEERTHFMQLRAGGVMNLLNSMVRALAFAGSMDSRNNLTNNNANNNSKNNNTNAHLNFLSGNSTRTRSSPMSMMMQRQNFNNGSRQANSNNNFYSPTTTTSHSSPSMLQQRRPLNNKNNNNENTNNNDNNSNNNENNNNSDNFTPPHNQQQNEVGKVVHVDDDDDEEQMSIISPPRNNNNINTNNQPSTPTSGPAASSDLRLALHRQQSQFSRSLTLSNTFSCHSITDAILNIKKDFSKLVADSYSDILDEVSSMKRDATYVLDILPMRLERDAALTELANANRSAFQVLDSRKDLEEKIHKINATLENEKELRSLEILRTKNTETELRSAKERILRMEGEATDMRFALHQRHKSENEKESVIVTHLSEQQRNLMSRAQELEKEKMGLELRLSEIQSGQLALSKRTKVAEKDAEYARNEFDKKVVEHEMAITTCNRLRQESDSAALKAENLKALLDQEKMKLDHALREAEDWRNTAQGLQRRVDVDENLMKNIMGGGSPGWLQNPNQQQQSRGMNPANNNNATSGLFGGFSTPAISKSNNLASKSSPNNNNNNTQKSSTMNTRSNNNDSDLEDQENDESSLPSMSIEQAAMVNAEHALIETQMQRARLESRIDAARKEGAKSISDLRRIWDRRDREMAMRELQVSEQQGRLDTFCQALVERMSEATNSERQHRHKCNILNEVNDELRKMCGLFLRKIRRQATALSSWESRQMARSDGVEFPFRHAVQCQTGEKGRLEILTDAGGTESMRFAADRHAKDQQRSAELEELRLKAQNGEGERLGIMKKLLLDTTSSTASRIRSKKGGKDFWFLVFELIENLNETYWFGGRILAVHGLICGAMVISAFILGLMARSC